jgi:uncharacterized integral membrane protein (TIGR00697 family)
MTRPTRSGMVAALQAASQGENRMAGAERRFKYYDLIMVAFVVVLICSNFFGAAKQVQISLPLFGPVTFGAAVLFFPIAYIFGDILTEVYGYGRDRRVVWAGFGALVFASAVAFVIPRLPTGPSDFMKVYQPALEMVFGMGPRIAAASMIAFWCGSFINSYVLAKMKIWSEGRWLWTRTIGSTVVGEAVDTALFYAIAFYGIWATSDLVGIAVAQYVLKTGYEIVVTPVTYRVVAFLKSAEGEDYYDRDTDFSPFHVKV